MSYEDSLSFKGDGEITGSKHLIDQRKVTASFLLVVIIIGIGLAGFAYVLSNTPATYYYEEQLPSSDFRDTRITLSGLEDANITVAFIDEPGLWYRIAVTHYVSGVRHSIESVTEPSFFPLRVHITSVTRIKSISIVLGTDVVHSLYISGLNLNTRVTVDNGAKISGSKCWFFASGFFHFILTENVNFTTEGMDVEVGDFFFPLLPDLAIFDIDLPPGLNGDIYSTNMTFYENEWPIHIGDHWSTLSHEEPLLDIDVFHSPRVWASLLL